MSGPTGPVAGEPSSPYPVQDWSRLVGDPPAAGARADPSWGPPRPGRSNRAALAAVLLVLALLVPALVWGSRLGAVDASSPVVGFVPADGQVTHSLRTVSGTGGATPLVTEHARLTGEALNSAVDWMVSARVLGALELDPRGKSLWRTTSTEAVGFGAPQETAVYRVGASLDLLAESRPGRGHVYQPALVVLPERVRSGSTWGTSGSAGPELTYRSTFQSSAGAGGCLRVAGEIGYFTAGGQPGPVRRLEDTWCPGRGLTSRNEQVGEATTIERPSTPVRPDPDLATVDRRLEWSDPARWGRTEFATITADPTFGAGPGSGSPASTALVSQSGLLFRRVAASDDIVALTPKTATEWLTLWRMHPGGRIVSLSAFGDVVVASTSQRRLVAYTDRGQRLWQLEFAELIFDPPIRVSDTELAVVDLSGDLRVVDVATGRVRWHRAVGTDVAHAPVAAAGVVAVSDGSGTTTGYALADGRPLWTVDLDRRGGAVALGEVLVVTTDRRVEAVAAADGRRRWVRPLAGQFTGLTAFGGSAVLSSSRGSQLIDPTGRATPLPRPYTLITAAENFAVGWGADTADAFDRAGRVVASWPVPPLGANAGARAAVGYSQGVILLGSDWSLTMFSDEA